MILTRRDVEAIAACVQACNDGGVLDPLLDKLRALWTFVDKDGLKIGGRFCGTCGDRISVPDAPRREPGAPDTVVVDPTTPVDSVEAGGEVLPESAGSSRLPPAAAVPSRLSFRPETIDSAVGGPITPQRRTRRTRGMDII